MQFYSQRGEDRKIVELLGRSDNVLWIDVGAWDPRIDSITKHFSDCGGHGINIEPNPHYFNLLKHDRPDDINLDIALSDTEGVLDFTIIPGTGLSTFRDEYAKLWLARFPNHVTQPTRVRTLADVCRTYVPMGQPIDFLKIDVEGWERQVLLGGDWTTYRPKILVIEATVPGTCDAGAIGTWSEWEDLVLSYDYEFVHYDQLNRFYRRR